MWLLISRNMEFVSLFQYSMKSMPGEREGRTTVRRPGKKLPGKMNLEDM